MRQRASACAVVAMQLITASGCCGRRSTEPPPSPPPPESVLPDSAYRVGWAVVKVPSRFRAGGPDTVIVRVRNDGDVTWPDRAMGDPSGDGRRAVRLSHRWIKRGESSPPPFEPTRVDLPRPLAAGESVELSVPVRGPAGQGPYVLQVDLVHELVAWFSDKGGSPLDLPVRVE